MASTYDMGQEPDNPVIDNKLDEELRELCVEFNERIERFERENGVQVLASSQGWLQYPEQYPNQKWLQLFIVLDSKSPIHRS